MIPDITPLKYSMVLGHFASLGILSELSVKYGINKIVHGVFWEYISTSMALTRLSLVWT